MLPKNLLVPEFMRAVAPIWLSCSVKSFYYALVSISVNNIVDVGRVASIAKPKSTQVYQIIVVLGVQDCRVNIYPYIYVTSYGNRRT